MFHTGLLLALLAATGYTLASFFLKLAVLRHAKPSQLNLMANLALALIAQPFWLFDDPSKLNAHPILPLITCLAFLAGQYFTFWALANGDVSIATPLLGTKVLGATAINAAVFTVPIPPQWWLASLAAFIGIATVAWGAPGVPIRSAIQSGIFAIASALFFSLTDVLVQNWAGAFDPFPFLATMFGGVGILSTLINILFDNQALRLHRDSVPPLAAGSLLLGLQAVLVFLALAWTRDATATNIVYSTRSLITILAARAIGSHFGLREAALPRQILVLRLAGALSLFIAIILILTA